MKINVNGILFDYLGTEPYTRLDGTPTILRVWRKQCEHAGCNDIKEFKSSGGKYGDMDPAQVYNFAGKNFTRRHCSKHYVRKQQDHSAGGRSTARVSDEDIAEMRRLASQEGASPAALSMFYPLTPGTIREILAGRRRAQKT